MKLVLEDGTSMEGVSFGVERAVRGEVVFNTGMTGYVETLTDPSYCGQILVLTYPLIGNYGVPLPRRAGSIDAPYESTRIQVQGLVVQSYVADFSHLGAVRSLGSWLETANVPAMNGIDTRTLTRRLREPLFLPNRISREQAIGVGFKDCVFSLVSPGLQFITPAAAFPFCWFRPQTKKTSFAPSPRGGGGGGCWF